MSVRCGPMEVRGSAGKTWPLEVIWLGKDNISARGFWDGLAQGNRGLTLLKCVCKLKYFWGRDRGGAKFSHAGQRARELNSHTAHTKEKTLSSGSILLGNRLATLA